VNKNKKEINLIRKKQRPDKIQTKKFKKGKSSKLDEEELSQQ